MSDARLWECSNEEYHADTSAISNSGLKEIRLNPQHYYAKRILKAAGTEEEEKEALIFGQKLHRAILARGPFPGGTKLIPRGVLNAQGHRKGAAWREFEAQNKEFELVKPTETLWKMLESAKRDPIVQALFETDGHHEHTIVWHYDKFGVDVRCRIDFLHADREVIVDLKSCGTGMSPRELSATIWKFGYHRQADLYCTGAEEMYGVRPKFVFVFMSKNPPYSVASHDLDEEFLALGREQNEEDLATYAECLKTGRWRTHTHGRITTLPPPGYAKYDKEWSVTRG